MVRPGECVDIYYYDAATAMKECFPTTQNTKYTQNFQNNSGGTSVFTIPPQNGVQDVICSFQFALTDNGGGAASLPQGWGYALIKQVSFRYGGSSQYFMTGDQLLQNAVRKQIARDAATDIMTIGGNYVAPANMVGTQSANVVLTLPHSCPTAFGKCHPLPTDLLTQQVQVTIELVNPVSSVFSVSSGALPTGSATLSSALFQVQQVMLNNQGDALARRVDMATNAYAFPAEFCQQKQQIALSNPGAGVSQSVVLTGFRSGEVKHLEIWLTRAGDTTAALGLGGNGSITTQSPFKWYLPDAVVMSYAGDIYARYNGQTSQLWNLVNNLKASAVNTSAVNTGSIASPGAWLSQWVELPFAQAYVQDDAHNMLVHGKPITNGIVNLDLTLPAAYVNATADWILNVSYVYNTTLLFSQGTCDYVF
jgi:hypothetical protein